jgi:hypothetical protein
MTRVGDEKKFLDAGTSDAHTIRPGLDGHHVPGAQNVLRARIDPWRLVDEEPNPVADAMGEFVFEV